MAPEAPLATLTSWSYSVYTAYMKCPLSVMFDKVKRIRMIEPPNPHLEKGDRAHKGGEAYINATGKSPTLPAEFKGVKDKLVGLRKLKARAELDWAFTKQWAVTTWNDWTNCWLRIKVDVCAETPGLVQIVDWKTGKVYDDHRQQRSLYALGGLQLIELGKLAGGAKDTKVTAEHVYLDTGQTATEEFTMKDLKPLKREWLTRTKQMMSDTKYPARPGFHCRYCRFRKSNGGPCPEDQ